MFSHSLLRYLRNDLVDLCPQHVFTLYYPGYLGIKSVNIDDLTGVFLLNIRRNGQVILVLFDLLIRHKAAEMLCVPAFCECRYDL